MTRRRLIPTVLAAAVCLPAAVAIGGASAQSSAEPEPIEMGERNRWPNPSCPASCEAIGRVTGYQVLAEGRRHVYRVPVNGKVVAWSLALSKPRLSQVKFFNDYYGTPPRARIAILRAGTRNRFRLTGQSPSINLTSYFGQRPIFALERPLTVKKGYFIAISVPTWAPAFATKLSLDNAWRASRPRDKCRNVKRRDAHQRRKSLRQYGCVYRTARLLYSATIVPDAPR